MKTVGQGEKQNIQDNNIENNEGGVKWCEGRRVVELGYLAESLGKCKNTECTRVLDLRNTIIERQICLGSVLLVKYECSEMNRVRTGKIHREKNNMNDMNNYPYTRIMTFYPKHCGNVRFVGLVVNDFR